LLPLLHYNISVIKITYQKSLILVENPDQEKQKEKQGCLIIVRSLPIIINIYQHIEWPALRILVSHGSVLKWDLDHHSKVWKSLSYIKKKKYLGLLEICGNMSDTIIFPRATHWRGKLLMFWVMFLDKTINKWIIRSGEVRRSSTPGTKCVHLLRSTEVLTIITLIKHFLNAKCHQSWIGSVCNSLTVQWITMTALKSISSLVLVYYT